MANKFINKHPKLKKLMLKYVNSNFRLYMISKPWMSDKRFLKYYYKKRMGEELNLENPVTFAEKLNWLKLHDRKPIYTTMVDKYLCKEFVKERVGEKYVVPNLGVWKNPKDIDFDKLPDKFVLKVNHAGGIVVCRDKSTFDRKKAIKDLKKGLKENYFIQSREWPYKKIKKRIIAEEYLGENLVDYKNYCFHGEVKFTYIMKNSSNEEGRKPINYFCGAYDTEWNKTDIVKVYKRLDIDVEKPKIYDEMRQVVEKIAKDIPFVRVDCYIFDDKLYIGEMTFFPSGGFDMFTEKQTAVKVGEMLDLTKVKK